MTDRGLLLADQPEGPASRAAERRVLAAVFVLLALFVLVQQNAKVGFEPNHHGWVSSHALAIFSHATPANGFVAYSVRREDEQGRTEYDYFERSPVFFSVLMHLWLDHPARPLARQVYLARQAMNVIFLATLVVAYLLLRELTGDAMAAAAAAVTTFSGSYFMFYKDMIHFEQPGLFGMLALVYAILLSRRSGRRWWLYLTAAFAASFGWGYVSLAFLCVWTAAELLIAGRQYWFAPWTAARRFLSADAPRLLVFSACLTAVYLTYNIAMEARTRGVPWSETSIVESGSRRSGWGPLGAQMSRASIEWRHYAPMMAKRMVKSAVPYAAVVGVMNHDDFAPMSPKIIFFALAGACLVALVLAAHLRRVPAGDRFFYLLTAFSGFGWFVLVRRHAAPHDYTSIYFAGLLLVFFAALFARLPDKLRWAGLAAALAVFAASNTFVNADHSRTAAAVNADTYDFERVLGRLGPGDRVYVERAEEMFFRRPFAPGFYLSRQILTPAAGAGYAISRRRDFAAAPLTPENHGLFLFRMKDRGERLLDIR